jgi:hypothetical protein
MHIFDPNIPLAPNPHRAVITPYIRTRFLRVERGQANLRRPQSAKRLAQPRPARQAFRCARAFERKRSIRCGQIAEALAAIPFSPAIDAGPSTFRIL